MKRIRRRVLLSVRPVLFQLLIASLFFCGSLKGNSFIAIQDAEINILLESGTFRSGTAALLPASLQTFVVEYNWFANFTQLHLDWYGSFFVVERYNFLVHFVNRIYYHLININAP